MVQQLREAFPKNTNDQYLILARDAKLSVEVDSAGIPGIHTSHHSPWQNGVAERWVRNVRNDLLDHVIVLHETISGAWRGIILATITPIALPMDWTKTRRSGDRPRSKIPVSDSHHIIVWEDSTIAISGQRLLKRRESNFGDVQVSSGRFLGRCPNSDRSPNQYDGL